MGVVFWSLRESKASAVDTSTSRPSRDGALWLNRSLAGNVKTVTESVLSDRDGKLMLLGLISVKHFYTLAKGYLKWKLV